MDKNSNVSESRVKEPDQDPSKNIQVSLEILERCLEQQCFPQDFFFLENTSITSKEIIQSYGKRLKMLCEYGKGQKKVTYKELAEVCGISVQAISNIIKGKCQSVNVAYCNRLALYLGCSAYYLLGLSDFRYGVRADAKNFQIPIIIYTTQETVDITQAGQWARLDRKLFMLMEKLFHADAEIRDAVYQNLKLLLTKRAN